MVTRWGLSDVMGPVLYGEEESQMPGSGNKTYSGATSREIDEEIRKILDACYKQAEDLLDENRDVLEAMKNALMEYETIDADQVTDLMERKPVRLPRDWQDGDFGGGSSAGGDKPIAVSQSWTTTLKTQVISHWMMALLTLPSKLHGCCANAFDDRRRHFLFGRWESL